MARVLLAWELGAHLGHLGQLALLANSLRARGHEPVFALRDVTGAESMAAGFPFVQAPVWPARLSASSTTPCTYPEILLHYGYGNGDGLLSMAKAWRRIFEWAAPDAIVFDHAPTALLAARGLDVVRVLYGEGFSSPPRSTPLPNYREWEDVPRARIESSESRVLETVNSVLRRLGEAPLAAFHELFTVEEDFLCTFSELDHYASRSSGRYCGPVFHGEAGGAAAWPEEGTQKICVYIRPGMRSFQPFAEALRDSPYRVLWIAPGADASATRPYETPRLKFVHEPVRLSEAAARADAAVLYGGHGTVSAMLLAGVPLVLCPNHVEQMLVSRNVARLGACSIVSNATSASGMRDSVEAVIADGRYRRQAAAFAAKYASFDPRGVVDRVAARIATRCARGTCLARSGTHEARTRHVV